MSLHLYSNLKIDNKLFLTNVQSQSLSGLSFLTSTGSNSIQVQDNGFVGIGKSAPQSLLHLSSPNCQLILENNDQGTNSASCLTIRSASQDWQLQNQAGTLNIVDSTAGVSRLTLSTLGDLSLTGRQHIVTGGFQKLTCVGCKTISGGGGTQSASLFQLGVPANSCAGVKTFITLTSPTNNVVKFEEYIGQLRHYGSNSDSAQVYQLAALPTATKDASIMNWTSNSMATGTLTAGVSGSVTVPFTYTFVVSGSNPSQTLINYFVEYYGSTGAAIA